MHTPVNSRRRAVFGPSATRTRHSNRFRARTRARAPIHRSQRGIEPMLNTISAAPVRAQLADTDDAILAFAVTRREPDRDVHQDDLAWWLAQQERIEIRAELANRGLL
jgi:hypothetical protein